MNDPGHTPGIQPRESLLPDEDEIDVGFSRRHIGPGQDEIAHMLQTVGAASLSQLMDETVPPAIRDAVLALPAALSEKDATEQLRTIADRNEVYTSLIGCGYHGTITPPVLRRNLLENPAWYTAYTPYQAEISQGRLDALLTFQTMVADLAGLDIANASLLDEGTAAAEAMAMLLRMDRTDRRVFLVDQDCHPQTVAVVQSRAEPIGIEVRLVDRSAPMDDDAFGLLVQYPGTTGEAYDLTPVTEAAHQSGIRVAVAADLLALVLLQSPGSCGADLVVGSTQRFGLPMWGGGPHAGFIAAPESAQRVLPGRVVGVSVDAEGRPALRLALQTREQHIRREKATSNICTAQVLPAVMAAMYACYHGPEGLQAIAARVHSLTAAMAAALMGAGWTLEHDHWFDTLTLVTEGRADQLVAAAANERINVRRIDQDRIGVSFDETTDERVLTRLLRAWDLSVDTLGPAASPLPDALLRTGALLDYAPFHGLRSETEMMRYLRRMADKDVALDRSMIPLGSCTMKLNAASEMEPVSWAEFAHIHPFAPAQQRAGYGQLVTELQQALAEITGYAAVSIQPNAGSQGELAGLLAIRGWHHSRDETQRDVCLIPSSAHGTNAASAVMAGMRVVVVACRENGDVDLDDLRERIEEHSAELAALMITYPSTHGVFEQDITDICAAVHDAGGQVYLDGANLNALVGLARPGRFGADVSHLNLHKTFCIPHGGGGPGVGPVAVGEHLVPFMPSHPQFEIDQTATQGPTISAAPWGSAGILPIPWMYITMMGATGLQRATEVAILSANYIATRLDGVFPVLYRGANGRVAHECVVDLRPLREETGVTVDDVAKRLIDYGFHAPTMSFPVAGTLMIEPTESENLAEVNRFCDAMISIAAETQRIASGEWPADNNPLVNAPHTAEAVTADEWDRPYTRTEAAWPSSGGNAAKIWPPVARIDGGFGDRNLVCSCPPLEELAAASMGAAR